MIQFRRSTIWLLLLFVGVAGIISDSVEERFAKAVQAATGRGNAPEVDDLDDDAESPAHTASGTGSTLLIQGDPHALTAPPVRSGRSLQVPSEYAPVFSQDLPSATPQLISLRL